MQFAHCSFNCIPFIQSHCSSTSLITTHANWIIPAAAAAPRLKHRYLSSGLTHVMMSHVKLLFDAAVVSGGVSWWCLNPPVMHKEPFSDTVILSPTVSNWKSLLCVLSWRGPRYLVDKLWNNSDTDEAQKISGQLDPNPDPLIMCATSQLVAL